MQTADPSTLKRRAQALQLNGLLSNWSACCTEPWVANLLDWEEQENTRRSMERRLHSAHIGRFKPLTEYDWSWPEQIDQGAVSDLMTLQFLQTASNAILVGPSGVGKTTIAQNIAHQAVLQGHTVIFTTAGKLLGELASLDSDSALRSSYSSRYADLLFELVSRRHEQKSTLLTTNKSFTDWNEVFPNAACVVALVDRLVHHAEIVGIKGESYRQKEAQEHAKARAGKRKTSKSKP